jgi:hypothetical protein
MPPTRQADAADGIGCRNRLREELGATMLSPVTRKKSFDNIYCRNH